MVTLHRGREASALAAAFNVLSLPAVVYLPPNCIAAVADECRCSGDSLAALIADFLLSGSQFLLWASATRTLNLLPLSGQAHANQAQPRRQAAYPRPARFHAIITRHSQADPVATPLTSYDDP